LEKAPKVKSEHIWADYLELLALQNSDHEVSKADLLNRVQERRDLGEVDSITDPTVTEVERADDKLGLFIVDCFRNLEYRQGAFKEAYPFTIEEKGRVLRRKDVLTPLNELYVFLLLAANLRCIESKKHSTDISSAFEIICLDALKLYLPGSASAILFGSNPRNTDGRFKGKLYKKILNLAETLNELPLVTEKDIDPQNTGDGGLDLVAYVPFSDSEPGMLYLFCQCACTDEWESKQHDCSHQAWENKIKFTSLFSHMIFVPFCYRDATGRWFNSLKILKSILVDRVRLIDLFAKTPSSLEQLPDLPSVGAFLVEEETLF